MIERICHINIRTPILEKTLASGIKIELTFGADRALDPARGAA